MGRKKLVLIFGCLSLGVLSAFAQKPMVKLDFRIAEELTTTGVFSLRYGGVIEEIEVKGKCIIENALNEYIGFARFTDVDAPHQLRIVLDKKLSGTGIIQVSEFYLFFEFEDENGIVSKHQWEFLDNNAFSALGDDVTILLQTLETSWREYLEGSFNQELVHKMFRKVSLPIPNGDHYLADVKEIIVPLRKEALSMHPSDCQFRIIIEGQRADGSPTELQQTDITFRGEVSNPDTLIGCMLFGPVEAENIVVQSGKLYILSYERKVYQDADLGDFFNEMTCSW